MDILIPTVTCNCICTITIGFIYSTVPDIFNVIGCIECQIPVMDRIDASVGKNKINAFVIDPARCYICRYLIIKFGLANTIDGRPLIAITPVITTLTNLLNLLLLIIPLHTNTNKNTYIDYHGIMMLVNKI